MVRTIVKEVMRAKMMVTVRMMMKTMVMVRMMMKTMVTVRMMMKMMVRRWWRRRGDGQGHDEDEVSKSLSPHPRI